MDLLVIPQKFHVCLSDDGKRLSLALMRLTAMPDWVGNVTALTELDLSGNQLTTLPGSLGNLTALTELDLSGNQLTTLPVQLAGLLERGTQLRLGGNPLNEPFLKLAERGARELATYLRYLQDHRWQRSLDLVRTLASVLLIAAIAAPGYLGFRLCDSLWPNGLGGESVVLGAFGPYLLSAFGVSLRYRGFRRAYLHTLLAFLASVPLIYALTSLVYLILSLADLENIWITQFLRSNLTGVLIGVGAGVLFGLAAALKGRVDDLIKGSSGQFDQILAAVLSGRLIFEFTIASLFDLPDRRLALIVLGMAWGVIAAIILIVSMVVIAHLDFAVTWIFVVIYESVLGIYLLWDIFFGFIGWMRPVPQVELMLPVLLAFPAICGLAQLCWIKGPQVNGRRRRW
jgi:hypothetical protein